MIVNWLRFIIGKEEDHGKEKQSLLHFLRAVNKLYVCVVVSIAA